MEPVKTTLDIALLYRQHYDYDPLTGIITRKSDCKIMQGEYIKFGGHARAAADFAWLHHYGEWPPEGKILDHKDRNRKNNRIENLRPATVQQNAFNVERRGPYRRKGVTFNGTRKKCWHAQIRVKGEKINLGRFENFDEAAEAYKRAALKYHGEFACVD